jgi:hypothetical protein
MLRGKAGPWHHSREPERWGHPTTVCEGKRRLLGLPHMAGRQQLLVHSSRTVHIERVLSKTYTMHALTHSPLSVVFDRAKSPIFWPIRSYMCTVKSKDIECPVSLLSSPKNRTPFITYTTHFRSQKFQNLNFLNIYKSLHCCHTLLKMNKFKQIWISYDIGYMYTVKNTSIWS